MRVNGVFLLFLVAPFRTTTSFSVPNKSSRRASWSLSVTSMDTAPQVHEESATKSATQDASPKTSSPLREYQEKAAPIATSFEPTDFRPSPLFTNCHLQTIGGVFLRDLQDCAYVSNVASTIQSVAKRALFGAPEEEEWFWEERKRIDTPDGDFFHVDFKYASGGSSKGTVVILHGLQSNSNSSLSTDLATAHYHRLGMDVAGVNFRGCSGVPNDTLGGYHLGFTDDFKLLLSLFQKDGISSRERPVYVSGYSLGANVALKALGELGHDAVEKYHVHGAAVTGPPFDNERNYPFVNAPGFNRVVYSGNFVKSLQKRTHQQLHQFCDGDPDTDKFDYRGAMAATTSYDWEEAFIAPVYGFDGYLDYYRKTSCIHFLDKIAVPTMVISAGDDPFFDPEVFPIDQSVEGGGPAPLKMVRTQHGGHLGYIFHQSEPGEKRVASWMPTELSRFLHHVHTHPHSIELRQ